jgi:signal transduction histidine kinase/phage shock protein PspC (stress-responsive transcriptional regulator)
MTDEAPATSPPVARRRRVRRDPEHGVAAGVFAGLGRRLGIDPLILRIGFGIAVFASGGVALIPYAFAWAMIPAEGQGPPAAARLGSLTLRIGSGWRVAAGGGLLMLSALLVFRQLGIWWSDAFVWPLVLAAAGAALLWRTLRAPSPDIVAEAVPDRTRTAAAPAPRSALRELYRGGFGVALVVGAALLFLSSNNALGAARDVVLVVVVVVVALALVLAPFLWQLGRKLAAERAARIRSQERAEVAAHLHDSVLQTLALMQKRANDPSEVVALARRQERELRSWLADGAGPHGDGFAAVLQRAAEEVEDAHRVEIELVTVGDRPIDDAGGAVIAAAREAMTNAAKFAGDSGQVRVYAEIDGERVSVFVRDRGPGFDADAVPADRRGMRESIVGRMERHGGRATINSVLGEGTEVELELEGGRG